MYETECIFRPTKKALEGRHVLEMGDSPFHFQIENQKHLKRIFI